METFFLEKNRHCSTVTYCNLLFYLPYHEHILVIKYPSKTFYLVVIYSNICLYHDLFNQTPYNFICFHVFVFVIIDQAAMNGITLTLPMYP